MHSEFVYLFMEAVEKPNVTINGSNNGQPVLKGGSVVLQCIPNAGIPPPQLRWGSSRPAGATTQRSGNSLVMVVNDVREDFCVNCTGTNIAGNDFDSECITVRKSSLLCSVSSSNEWI